MKASPLPNNKQTEETTLTQSMVGLMFNITSLNRPAKIDTYSTLFGQGRVRGWDRPAAHMQRMASKRRGKARRLVADGRASAAA